jgi:5-formyltetrahydrofolate cyclo-ligase
VIQKSKSRKNILRQRDHLSSSEWSAASRLIQERVMALTEFQQAKHIGLYKSFRHEVNTDVLFDHAHQSQQKTSYPWINPDRSLTFRQIESLANLESTAWGFQQPSDSCPVVERDEIDLFVIPAVAFNARRQRLGLGWGCYDRYLENCQNFTVGVVFDFQIIEDPIFESHDFQCDTVMTQERVLNGRSR